VGIGADLKFARAWEAATAMGKAICMVGPRRKVLAGPCSRWIWSRDSRAAYLSASRVQWCQTCPHLSKWSMKTLLACIARDQS
jgi:hypothetical protein